MAQIAWRHKTAKPAFGVATVMIILADRSVIVALDLGLTDAIGQVPFG